MTLVDWRCIFCLKLFVLEIIFVVYKKEAISKKEAASFNLLYLEIT